VSGEEKSAEKALWPKSLAALMLAFICRERISPARFGKNSFLAAYFFDGLFFFHLDSRTKMRPSSKGFPVPAVSGAGRNSLGQHWTDSGNG
jgi:hypothetical protein